MNFHKDLRLDQDSTLLVISGNNTIASKEPVRFKAGKYVISFKAFGSVAGDKALPVLVTDIADSLTIKYSRIEVEPKSYTIKFELQDDVTGKLNLSFINDYADELGDRNIYLYFPIRVFRF